MACLTDVCYTELQSFSNFSFLQGASRPEELVEHAGQQHYQALAITDECSLSGIVRAYEKATEMAFKLIIGSTVFLADGPGLILLVTDRHAYGQLCELITKGRRSADKGQYLLYRKDVENIFHDGIALLLMPDDIELQQTDLEWFEKHFKHRGWLAVHLNRDGRDKKRLAVSADYEHEFCLPRVAVGNVKMHRRGRRVLADLLTAIRLNKPVAELGTALLMNGEQHLRSLQALVDLYPPELLRETENINQHCQFSLAELSYQYPDDVTPENLTAAEFLRQLTEEGIKRRWPEGCSKQIRQQIEYELALIQELTYEAYFLTIWDIVRFAREQNILCQGRGSAANSAVCYCLGITEVDPARMAMLFERFISRERGEPPDIDVDFEHNRREQVMQYIYQKYGRDRAALAASLVTYRPKSAIRDVARALSFSADQTTQLLSMVSGWGRRGELTAEQLAGVGFNPDNPIIRRFTVLVNMLLGFPRHLSQHVGGFVITQKKLSQLVPIENAAMADRTVIQWDKDDLETMGLLKVDVLSLGMLSAIHKAFDSLNRLRPEAAAMAMHKIPADDAAVYQMIQQADTIGVFQIESRGQMSMLPRLRPACFYDLVIEVAIVRPGPIQGDMVHPYLRRRQGIEAVEYPSDAVREVLDRTLGIPIFQEQVIKLAMVAGGFSPGQADQLRRSMAAWKRRGGIEVYRQQLMDGMVERGYSAEYADRIFKQIQGFGEYGFPESHAASFALLVYVSAWLKCHHPAAFTAALLNSLPMGFYAPAQLVIDARQHQVDVRAVDINHSYWDCTLEVDDKVSVQKPALRLGFCRVKGINEKAAERIVQARVSGVFKNAEDLARRASLNRSEMQVLASADAFVNLLGHRFQSHWLAAGTEMELPVYAGAGFQEQQLSLLAPSVGEDVLADYRSLGLSLKAHPLSLLREQLSARGILSAEQVAGVKVGQTIYTAGLVLIRQRPGKGNAVFITLEDETGTLNLLVWQSLAEKQRKIVLNASLLAVYAEIQRMDGVQHLMVKKLEDHSTLLGQLTVKSRDFC